VRERLFNIDLVGLDKTDRKNFFAQHRVETSDRLEGKMFGPGFCIFSFGDTQISEAAVRIIEMRRKPFLNRLGIRKMAVTFNEKDTPLFDFGVKTVLIRPLHDPEIASAPVSCRVILKNNLPHGAPILKLKRLIKDLN